METWKAVAGFEGCYEISSDGRLKSLGGTRVRYNRGVRQEVFRGPRINIGWLCNGYLRATLIPESGPRVKEYLHRIVCAAFHGPQPEGCEVAHQDGDRTNNRADNLRWASRLENIRDKPGHGTQLRGSQLCMAKLTEDDVVAIRSMSENNTQTARKFGVSRTTISMIRNGYIWKHVGG